MALATMSNQLGVLGGTLLNSSSFAHNGHGRLDHMTAEATTPRLAEGMSAVAMDPEIERELLAMLARDSEPPAATPQVALPDR